MPDPYASIAQAAEELQARLAGVLELRAADPQQRAMLEAYLSEIQLPSGATALEVGCGTGAVTRALAALPGMREVIGIDPSPIFIQKARELGKALSALSFDLGDARALQFANASFDLVVFHTTLCHVPEPNQALSEAHRVLRPGGWLAVFDGDYPSVTVVLESMGFTVTGLRSHGYTQTTEPTYMLTIIDRGADLLAGAGSIGRDQAEALKAEARRRAASGEFFGHISFVSVNARKK
jgi:ubiquinone/menaquinone biosynthesis C-methylase UbiE